MPLRFDVEEYLGTNADQSHSDEFCYYCLKDGEYTVDIPMEQMVDIWVKYTDKYNEYADTHYTPLELRTLLNKRMPTLRRWKQKQVTLDIHYGAVDKIKSYIDRNLAKDIDMDELCRMANLSFFYVRKVFRKITGENIGSYIQRLRLENVGHLLVSTSLPVNEIVKKSGYQTKSSLAKAFRKHFGLSMSEWRERYAPIQENDNQPDSLLLCQPEVRKIAPQKAVCYPISGSFPGKDKYMAAWRTMIHYREKHIGQEADGRFISISMDNPSVTAPEQRRFFLGVLTSANHKPEGKFSVQEIPGGLYAVCRHKGNYTFLPDIYKALSESWLPRNGYVQRNTHSFEVYLNTPRDTEASKLLTEIYIPIEKQ